MSITNQYGDIRGAYLCTSKAHSQFEPALHSIANSLQQYGHQLPQLFFTDNVDDAPLLKRCFPSLAEGVTPVDPNASLPLFTIPSDVTVTLLYTTNQIKNAMRSIMDILEVDNRDQTLVIGLDAEWNVRPGSSSLSNTAVMQIAFEKHIYVIPVCACSHFSGITHCSNFSSHRLLDSRPKESFRGIYVLCLRAAGYSRLGGWLKMT